MPTAQQTIEIAQAAAQVPTNNLLVFLAIFMAVVVIVVMWKVVPPIINLYKQQVENNRIQAENSAKLTVIVEQNSAQTKLAIQSIADNTGEMRKQTDALGVLSADFRGYTSTAAESIDEFRADVDKQHAETKADIAAIKIDIATHMEGITKELGGIKTALEERNECADVMGKFDSMKSEWDKFHDEVLELLTPANVIKDDTPPAELPKAS
ncbi:MAG: hypothetical protein LCI00_16795 [Chloroflexi bacterium]|nr:hypothetical protein [Chloroflexota bacterium]